MLVVLAIAAVAAVSIHATAPYCPPGATCVRDAGVSIVVPSGWSSQPADRGELLVLMPGKDSAQRIVIEDGNGALERPYGTLGDVEAKITKALDNTTGSFTHIDGLATERVRLPVGPGVRVRYVSTTTFIMSHTQVNDSIWFFANGRLLVVSWQVQRGEAPGAVPPEVMNRTLRSVLDSMHLLDS